MSFNPEHNLFLDVTKVDAVARFKLINAALKVGAKILNEDVALLIDSAPPEPRRIQRYGLETELASRDPFSFMIPGKKKSSSILRKIDPDFKKDLKERLIPKGYKGAGVVHAIQKLEWLHADIKRGLLSGDEMGITAHDDTDYLALTFSSPRDITAERLMQACRGLGDIGVDTTLALLVDVSNK